MFKDSYSDGGTLNQLKHLINRSNVPKKPSKGVNATEDFLRLVTVGHTIAASMAYFKMEKTTDEPTDSFLQELSKCTCPQKRKEELFHSSLTRMLQANLLLTTLDSSDVPTSSDKVNVYARELLSLGLLVVEFEDAIKEGDGDRVQRCWKFLLLIFKSAKRKNYAIEAFHFLIQSKVLFSPRLREQLLWSRFVNTKGMPACNIPLDLHNEYLNLVAKGALGSQASNITPKTVCRTGKIIGPLATICSRFDEDTNIHKPTSQHASTSFKKDLDRVVDQLHNKSKVFQVQTPRQHSTFPQLSGHIIVPLRSNKEKLLKWMKQQLKHMDMSLLH